VACSFCRTAGGTYREAAAIALPGGEVGERIIAHRRTGLPYPKLIAAFRWYAYVTEWAPLVATVRLFDGEQSQLRLLLRRHRPLAVERATAPRT
jgi:hypothetical protein